MSSSRPSSGARPAARSAPARCTAPGRSAAPARSTAFACRRLAVPAAALAGLALLGACGTVSAQSGDSTGVVAASTGTRAPSPTATPTGTPTPTAASTPAAGAAVLRVRVPLVLPASGAQRSGEVTGVVTIGLNQCLFLRTDAGQRFGLVGSLGDHVRTLLIARMVPLHVGAADPATPAVAGGYEVHVHALGAVTTGASVCSSPYEFTASSGDVDSAVTPLR